MINRSVRMNYHTNLLELEEHMYPLVDVETPNVFHNLFPYTEIPKIAFNDRIVPHHMPDDIWITDTTFRDGQQSRAPYSTEQIVTIYDYLHKLGGENGKIRQSEFFLYSKKDRDAVYKCLERGYKFPEVTSWIRASKKDFELVKDLGLKETGILVSCSDYHIFYKMKMTRKQAMEHYLSVIRECLETGISPRCHLEDITRADIYGYVIPFCLELTKLMDEYSIPIKVRCCDTMGYGVNYPGAVIPRSIPGIIYGIMTHAGFPSELIEFHGHNDFYKAEQTMRQMGTARQGIIQQAFILALHVLHTDVQAGKELVAHLKTRKLYKSEEFYAPVLLLYSKQMKDRIGQDYQPTLNLLIQLLS